MSNPLRLFLDDERHPADDGHAWWIVRSAEVAIASIEANGCPMFFSFDHDLGRDKLTGFDFAKWLVQKDLDAGGEFFPSGFWYYVHSLNREGAVNIDRFLWPYLMKHRVMPAGWKIGWDGKKTCPFS